MTKKVIFYTADDWAFGSIHTQLCKYLHKYRISANILSWYKSYTLKEIEELIDNIDIVVTNPAGWRVLKYTYNFPIEKCSLFIHARLDMQELVDIGFHKDIDNFHSYCVVSNWLYDLNNSYEISRKPKILPLGIDYNLFKCNISKELNTVGYASTFKDRKDPLTYIKESIPGTDHVKRAYLVKESAEICKLKFKLAQDYNTTFLTMPAYYRTVDSIVCTSIEEGAGLPVLEAAAAGKLVFTTPVGHWGEKVKNLGADVLPLEETELLDTLVEKLMYYKNNPSKYRQRCLEIQEFAKTYDWDYVIQDWLDLILE